MCDSTWLLVFIVFFHSAFRDFLFTREVTATVYIGLGNRVVLGKTDEAVQYARGEHKKRFISIGYTCTHAE